MNIDSEQSNIEIFAFKLSNFFNHLNFFRNLKNLYMK